MPKFTNFDQIEEYLRSQVTKSLSSSSGSRIEDYLKDEMYDAVYRYVYEAYTPMEYSRRQDNDGLSDRDNMYMAYPYINTQGKIQIDFYNNTTGSDPDNENKYTSDLIEFGKDSDIAWNNPNGPWANPREFKQEMTEKIKSNPSQLLDAVKAALKDSGFAVR